MPTHGVTKIGFHHPPNTYEPNIAMKKDEEQSHLTSASIGLGTFWYVKERT